MSISKVWINVLIFLMFWGKLQHFTTAFCNISRWCTQMTLPTLCSVQLPFRKYHLLFSTHKSVLCWAASILTVETGSPSRIEILNHCLLHHVDCWSLEETSEIQTENSNLAKMKSKKNRWKYTWTWNKIMKYIRMIHTKKRTCWNQKAWRNRCKQK